MKRVHEPGRLDVAAFAADKGELQGTRPVHRFARLADFIPSDVPDEPVQWSARGELRRPNALEPETWLHLGAQATVWMTCQRCLQPVDVSLDVRRAIRFVRGEQEAARLDAETEDDVLELERSVDLTALVEDELLLALPLVPRHEQCPVPLPEPAPEEVPGPVPNPFAALQALKRRE
jgi:uncharacterized protein